MNADNVYQYLSLAKEMDNDDYATECLNYISEKMGIRINDDEMLSLYITDPNISFEELSNELTKLSKVYEDKLEIGLTPSGKPALANLENFTAIHGKHIKSLNLKQVQNVDDQFLQQIIKNCPNLRLLVINSSLVTDKGVKNIVDLKLLKALELSECMKIEDTSSLSHLTHLEFLDLSHCGSLSKLPDIRALPKLQEIHLMDCNSIKDEHRFEILLSLLDHNFEQGIQLLKGFHFNDVEEVLDLISNELETKLQNQAMNPVLFLLLANYVLINKDALGLDETNPIIEDAQLIVSANELSGKKNPFTLFNDLSTLSNQESSFYPPSMKIQGSHVAIDMSQLKNLTNAVTNISREDVPNEASLEAFTNLTQSLLLKFKNHPKETKEILDRLQFTEASIETPIAYLKGLLSIVSDIVSDPEAKWRAVLNSILHEEQEVKNHFFFTNQEQALMTVLAGIGNCGPKKNEGIAAAYEIMNPKYRYNVNLANWVSAEDDAKKNSRNDSLVFIKNFIQANPDNTIKAIIKSVNTGDSMYAHAGLLLPLNKNYWDFDDAMNEFKSSDDEFYYVLSSNGAHVLSQIPDAEEKIFLTVSQILKSVMQEQFLGENSLMNELTQAHDIEQSVHQSLYMQNMIGHLVGVSSSTTFDWHTGVLFDALLEKSQDEVLAAFFKHVTPKTVLDELIRSLNKASSDTKEALQFVLLEDKFFENRKLSLINEVGALKLLIDTGYLK